MRTTQDKQKAHRLLVTRHDVLRAVRDYFFERDFIEVETANMISTVPPDPHIDPLSVFAGEYGPFFLHTSPEVAMKKLLPLGHKRIFQICKVYRVEDHQEVHNTEFTMLEWYREGSYLDTMEEAAGLTSFVVARVFGEIPDHFELPYPVHDLEILFTEKMGFNPFLLDRDEFFLALSRRGFIGVDDKDDWNSLFFKVFVQEIEDMFRGKKPCFITGWPASISTMAKEVNDNCRKVERFELYIDGIEIANGYSELTDPLKQGERFTKDNASRTSLGKRTFSVDERFLGALQEIDWPCAGVSVGLDRLLMVLLGKKTIGDVLADRLIVP